MKQLLTAILTLIALVIHSQDTQKVKKEHENPWYIEEYHILKSDKNIKHGSYKRLGYKKCLLLSGYYKNNLKDSLWTEFFWRTAIIESQGNYKEDKKTGQWVTFYRIENKNTIESKGDYKDGERIGVWEFYNQQAELIQKYNYNTKELLYFKIGKEEELEYEIKATTGVKKVKLDSPPMYIGGQSELIQALTTILKYPNEAKENGISGTVWISFYIDMDGNAIDHQIEEGIGGGCDAEALRAVKEIPNNWLPGRLNGQIVMAKYLFPVKFRLQ